MGAPQATFLSRLVSRFPVRAARTSTITSREHRCRSHLQYKSLTHLLQRHLLRHNPLRLPRRLHPRPRRVAQAARLRTRKSRPSRLSVQVLLRQFPAPQVMHRSPRLNILKQRMPQRRPSSEGSLELLLSWPSSSSLFFSTEESKNKVRSSFRHRRWTIAASPSHRG